MTPTGAGPGPAADRVAAPAVRRVAAQAAAEVRAVLRNGEQLLVTLVLPVLLLVVVGRTSLLDLGEDRLDVVVPGVMAVAVMSTALTSQAIATAFDRRQGVLRLLATTPLGRGGLLAGKVVAVAAVELGQLAVLGAVGAVLGWRPDLTGLPWALLLLVSGTAAFGALGLLLAGTLRAEAVLATANLLWVLLLVGGAVLVPAELTPGPLGALAPLLPSGALGEGLRSALTGGGAPLGEVATLTVWAGALSWATARTFRWS